MSIVFLPSRECGKLSCNGALTPELFLRDLSSWEDRWLRDNEFLATSFISFPFLSQSSGNGTWFHFLPVNDSTNISWIMTVDVEKIQALVNKRDQVSAFVNLTASKQAEEQISVIISPDRWTVTSLLLDLQFWSRRPGGGVGPKCPFVYWWCLGLQVLLISENLSRHP